MKKLILSFGLLFCFSTYLLAGNGEVSDFNALRQTSTPPTPPSTTPLHKRQKREIAFEISNYLYKQNLSPEKLDEEYAEITGTKAHEEFLKLTGAKYGISWKNLGRIYLSDSLFVDNQANFMFGLLDLGYDLGYEDDTSEEKTIRENTRMTRIKIKSLDDIPNFHLDVRELVHYPIPVSDDINLELCPFSGLGFRFLYESFPAFMYDERTKMFSECLYIPLGMTFECQLENGLSFDICGEFDWMFLGWHTTIPPSLPLSLTKNRESEIFHNIQNNGYGLRLSGKVSKKFENVELFVGGFFRYWSIPESGKTEKTTTHSTANMIVPKNYTREIGIKFGVSF